MRHAALLFVCVANSGGCAPVFDFDTLIGDAASRPAPDAQDEGAGTKDVGAGESDARADAHRAKDAPVEAPGETDGPAESAADAGPNPCAAVPDMANGLYCGMATKDGFAGGSPVTLYYCQHGKLSSTSNCSYGCYVSAPGTDDGCYADPCKGVAADNGGPYCGSSHEGGFLGGSSDIVYDCESSKTAGITLCAKGCYVACGGTPDGCNM